MDEFVRENWVYLLLIIFFIFVSLFEYGCNRCAAKDQGRKKEDQEVL